MTWRFPYDWAGVLDTDALAPCRVYRRTEHGRPDGLPGGPDLAACLRSPIGAPPLAQLLRVSRARTVLILVDDLTRPTPQAEMLPPVLDCLADAGIAEQDVTVLVATGLHRTMTAEEIAGRFGPRVAGRLRVVCHDARDRAAQVSLGIAGDGTPIMVNRLAKEIDFVLSVGCIEPHRVAGFSGGAKMVQPGICGQAVTASIHWRGWLTEGEEIYATADNPIRSEMEVIAELAGLRFIVNVVLGPDGRPWRYFCGDPRTAFRAGCRESLQLASVETEPADIVVADSWPFDIDLIQACKAVSVAELIVRPGGTVVLVTPCPEGLSQHEEEIRRTGYLKASEVVRRVADGSLPSLSVACHMMALGRTLQRGELLVVSPGLGQELCREMGLSWVASVPEAIAVARSRLGPDASVAILEHPCTMVPVIRDERRRRS
ncbi:MAG: nickel-dependent lactate racemase [Spirochaetes bacterium]|nr:nickel-dependent lactate racemase [Spirochaetota bacterium]